MRDTRTVVFIGRFQPFHLGHLQTVRWLHDHFDRVIVVIGSAQESHTSKNPFTAGERYNMIRRTLLAQGMGTIDVIPVVDVPNNSMWMSFLKSQLPHFDVVVGNNPIVELLAQQGGVEALYTPPSGNRELLSGTKIRWLLTHGPVYHENPDKTQKWEALVSDEVLDLIRKIDGEYRLRRLSNGDKYNEEG